MRNCRSLFPIILMAATPIVLNAQRPELSESVLEYVSVNASEVALTNVTIIDGTGAPAMTNQTILIRDGRIAAIGDRGSVRMSDEAQVMDLTGHTVFPGMVGLHDHLFYTAAGGRATQATYTAPRLYLGAGVTTVRTTGSRAAYAEINLKYSIDNGQAPGPRIHITAPYITGGQGISGMARINTPEQARRFVAYWAAEGATWIKVYTNISRAALAAAIEEAHEHGVRVTGHLCSVSFTEAVELGIDNIEHGLLTNTDYAEDKQPDQCPEGAMVAAGNISLDDPRVAATFQTMIDAGIPMTSTLAVFELFVPGRPTLGMRTLDAMAPEVREDYVQAKASIDEGQSPFSLAMFLNSIAYEKAFFDAGGLLAAGVDPTGNGGALPGYGDQRNYELLLEGGFTAEEAIQVLSANGARVLGIYDELGSIGVGKIADLVVVEGDLSVDDSTINNSVIVFKDGVGYDSHLLFEAVQGRVGIN